MGITTDACHPTHSEVKGFELKVPIFPVREPSLFKERNNKTPETAVYVESNVV